MDQELDYLYNLQLFGVRLGLERMEQLLIVLGNPQHSFKTIQVAGTNGKGSTCSYLASILKAAGLSVGLYTSPHLIKFNERIKVDGLDITDGDLVQLIKKIRAAIEENSIETTFFEFTTALAFLYFAKKKVDVAVIEVGLGGRLDATNVLTPLVSVITNINFDHMDILGDTKEQIAKEKAAIIKRGIPLVTAEEDQTVFYLFKEECLKKKSPMHIIEAPQILSSTLGKQQFLFSGKKYLISMDGKHQVKNAALAAKAIAVSGLKIPEVSLEKGLREAFWPGRLEIVSRKPLIIVDGAHNVAGVETLAAFLQTIEKKDVLVLALAKDKEKEKIVQMLVPLFRDIIVTEGSHKPLPADILAEEVKKHTDKVLIIPDIKEAVEKGLEFQKDGLLLATGSLYMIGDALKFLKESLH
ncbi:bifunctional tetrahydrofolate synthase/dihydrofolate synthase [Candidatus Woesearchaeota archaeon CG10_big_fil_rev_8_21_14_0_10_45_16]|nr:MAG: bifunctional tetrahydrofolate synthase/dihydrofolate synthase [Candidatus Woesearchaeota archaeon CG10_big_fil_rev_8_21_14_0_10_45_16]